MPEQTFEVGAEAAGGRLDQFLTLALKQTRSQVQKHIKEGLVTVNDEATTVHRWLKAGDRIVVREPKSPAPVAAASFKIIAETPEYLIVYKPVGVVVHPAPASRAPVLTTALLALYPEIATVGDPARPGIVHRLDRDVSGLLVVARTPVMYNHLVSEFQAHHVHKIYTALVEGSIEKPDGVIDFVIAHSRTKTGLMAARPKGQEGKAAETRYTVMKRWPHLTLLELELITGRTHQIRAHLKAFRHPLVGDALYGSKDAKQTSLKRPFLEATSLSFTDLAGEEKTFTVPLDHELVEFLDTL